MNDLLKPVYIKVYVGVDDLSAEFKDENKKFLLDFIISHKDGYKGRVSNFLLAGEHGFAKVYFNIHHCYLKVSRS